MAKFSMGNFEKELEELYPGGITIHGITHKSIKAWRRADPIAFREEWLNWEDSRRR